MVPSDRSRDDEEQSGHGPGLAARAASAGAGGLDKMASGGPSQPQALCGAVGVFELCKESILITSFCLYKVNKEGN